MCNCTSVTDKLETYHSDNCMEIVFRVNQVQRFLRVIRETQELKRITDVM